MKKWILTLTALLTAFLLSACDNNNETTKTDNDIDESETEAITPSAPSETFFSKQQNIQYSFKGIIHSKETVENSDPEYGDMQLTSKIEGIDFTKTSYPAVYIEKSEAAETLVLNSLENFQTTDDLSNYTYYYFENKFNLDKIKELKNKGQLEFTAEESDAFSTIEKHYVKNRRDGSQLIRKCFFSVSPENDTSTYFINQSENKDFNLGETVIIYGNIAIDKESEPDKTEGYTTYLGEHCQFYIDNKVITQEKYEYELNRSMSDFDCEIPEELLAPSADNYGFIKMMAIMNAVTAPEYLYSTGRAEYSLDDEKVTLPTTKMEAFSTQSEGKEIVTLNAYSESKINEGVEEYKLLQAVISKSLLQKAKDAGNETLIIEDIISNPDTEAFLYDVKEKYVPSEDKNIMKVCVKALPANAENSKMFFCLKNNTDFSGKEEIQGILNTPLEDDIDYIYQQTGAENNEELCSCLSYQDSDTEYTTEPNCDKFNQN